MPQRRDGTGVTFGAAGQLMDLSRNRVFHGSCYMCKKTGHLARDCPDKQQGGHKAQIRPWIVEMTKEECEELLKGFGKKSVDSAGLLTKSDLDSGLKKQKNISLQCTHASFSSKLDNLSKIKPNSKLSAEFASVNDVIKKINKKN